MVKYNYQVYFIMVFLLCSTPLLAQSRLLVAEDFNIISVNGKVFNNTLTIDSRHLNLKLKTGINKIALQYEVAFKNTDKRFETVKSDVFIISLYLQNNRQYRLRYLKQANLKAARKYISNPQISVVDSQNKEIKIVHFFPSSQRLEQINQQTKRTIQKQSPIRIESAKTNKNKPLETFQKIDMDMTYNQREMKQASMLWQTKVIQLQRKLFINSLTPII